MVLCSSCDCVPLKLNLKMADALTDHMSCLYLSALYLYPWFIATTSMSSTCLKMLEKNSNKEYMKSFSLYRGEGNSVEETNALAGQEQSTQLITNIRRFIAPFLTFLCLFSSMWKILEYYTVKIQYTNSSFTVFLYGNSKLKWIIDHFFR
jgi:hypothetical protein